MKQAYAQEYGKEYAFQKNGLALISEMDAICETYRADGYQITVRQLYYQLVTKNLIENSAKSYDKTQRNCNKARMAGLLDWDVFEDRTRACSHWQHFEDKQQALDNAARTYGEDMWLSQDRRVYVMAEKDAVAGILEPACGALDVPFQSNRGFCSATTLRELATGYLMPDIEAGQYPVILYFGDHDPSGLGMDEDIKKRLATFCGFKMDFHRIALIMEQVEAYDLPPNFAKLTDKRAPAYIKRYGNHSWELDALTPDVMVELLKKSVSQYIDADIWREDAARIEAVRRDMRND